MQPRKPHMITFRGLAPSGPASRQIVIMEWCWDYMTAHEKKKERIRRCSHYGRSQTGPRQAGCSPSPQPRPGCCCCPPGGPEPKPLCAGRLVPHLAAEDAVRTSHLQDKWAGENCVDNVWNPASVKNSLPALWRISIFCGLAAKSEMVWTNCILDFWYCSKTAQ